MQKALLLRRPAAWARDVHTRREGCALCMFDFLSAALVCNRQRVSQKLRQRVTLHAQP